MVKVKLTDKTLIKNYIRKISVASNLLLFFLTFIDTSQKSRIAIVFLYLTMLLVFYLILWIVANKKKEKEFICGSTRVNIKYGDIFSQDGVKVIAFNEYFDTKVDEKIISSRSLNGIYINQYSDGAESLDRAINSNTFHSNSVLEENVSRLFGGKSTKYRLGTICPVGDYFLLAFTHFDEENRAYISVEDYITCLMHMWSELDKYYAGRPISITLLGSGITRFNDCKISPQDLLEYIIMTFKASKVKFNNTACLTVVLDENVKNEINLYNLKGE